MFPSLRRSPRNHDRVNGSIVRSTHREIGIQDEEQRSAGQILRQNIPTYVNGVPNGGYSLFGSSERDDVEAAWIVGIMIIDHKQCRI